MSDDGGGLLIWDMLLEERCFVRGLTGKKYLLKKSRILTYGKKWLLVVY